MNDINFQPPRFTLTNNRGRRFYLFLYQRRTHTVQRCNLYGNNRAISGDELMAQRGMLGTRGYLVQNGSEALLVRGRFRQGAIEKDGAGLNKGKGEYFIIHQDGAFCHINPRSGQFYGAVILQHNVFGNPLSLPKNINVFRTIK